MGGLNILALCCAVCGVSWRFKRRIEETLPICVCAGMLVLFLLAMARKLLWVDGIALVMVVLSFLWLLIGFMRRRLTMKALGCFLKTCILTPGFVAVLALGIGFWILTYCRVVGYGDDLEYWAVQVKSLWYSKGLVDGAHHCALTYSSYTPGMSLVEWWVMHIVGAWEENVLFFALFFVNSLFLLPLIKRSTFKRWGCIPLFVFAAIAGPTMFTGAVYQALWTDSTLGFLLGFVLYQLWDGERGNSFTLLSVGLALCAMALAKETGLIWVLVSFGFFVLVCKGTRQGRWNWRYSCVFVSPVIVTALWKVFCWRNGLGSFLTDTGQMSIQSLLDGSFVRPTGTGLVLKHMLHAIFLVPTNMDGAWNGMTSWLGIPPAAWLVVFILLAVLWEKTRQREPALAQTPESKSLPTLMIVIGLCYALVFYLGFFTVFYYEARIYAARPANVGRLMNRYGMPVYFGIGYLMTGMWLAVKERFLAAGQSRLAKRIAGCMLAILLLFTNWQALWSMIPKEAARSSQSNHIAYLREHTPWFLAIKEEEIPETRFIAARNDSIAHYANAMVPASFVRLSHQQLAIATPDTLLALIRDQKVTHMVAIDDQNLTYELAEKLFGFPMEIGQLYRIEQRDDSYQLVEVEH